MITFRAVMVPPLPFIFIYLPRTAGAILWSDRFLVADTILMSGIVVFRWFQNSYSLMLCSSGLQTVWFLLVAYVRRPSIWTTISLHEDVFQSSKTRENHETLLSIWRMSQLFTYRERRRSQKRVTMTQPSLGVTTCRFEHVSRPVLS